MIKPSLLASLALLGCATDPIDGGLDEGKGDDAGDPNSIAVTWTVENLQRGEVLGCNGPDGITLTTAAVEYAPFENSQEVTRELFDCADGRATIPKVDPGEYSVGVGLEDEFGFWAGSTLAFVTLDGETRARVDERIFEDAGRLTFLFKLVGADSGKTLGCDKVPDVDAVEIVITKSGSMDLVTQSFDCESFGGLTDAMLVGDYVVSLDAFDRDSGTAIGVSEPFQTTITAPNGLSFKTGFTPIKIPSM